MRNSQKAGRHTGHPKRKLKQKLQTEITGTAGVDFVFVVALSQSSFCSHL